MALVAVGNSSRIQQLKNGEYGSFENFFVKSSRWFWNESNHAALEPFFVKSSRWYWNDSNHVALEEFTPIDNPSKLTLNQATNIEMILQDGRHVLAHNGYPNKRVNFSQWLSEQVNDKITGVKVWEGSQDGETWIKYKENFTLSDMNPTLKCVLLILALCLIVWFVYKLIDSSSLGYKMRNFYATVKNKFV